MTPQRLLRLPWLPRLPANFARCSGIVAMVTLLVVGILGAKADDSPVRRRTDSADADLITELLAVGMVNTAIKICERHTDDSQTSGDDQVRWLIQWSRAQVALMLRDRPELEQTYLVETIRKLETFLLNNPEHSRVLWLRFQSSLVELAAAKRAVLMAALKTDDDPERDAALKRIVRVANSLRDLSKSIEEDIAMERTKAIDSVRVQDLVSLAVVVATKRIEAVMVRGELFTEASNDYVAAATESLAASRALFNSMRPGSDGRNDLMRYLAESLRRTGELEQASITIAPLLETDLQNDATRALAARIAIDHGDLTAASDLLHSQDSRESSSGIESDLMSLHLAIAVSESDKTKSKQLQREIGDRVQRIGKQHGDYARRRAESLVLGTSIATTQSELDPRIIIAQAASRLRDGQADQAAQFLATAARSTRDSSAAVQLAIAGAAAFRQAKDIKNAAGLLREISLAHFETKDAAKLHLQSAVMLADFASPESLIEHLQECRVTWPQDAAAATATDWIVRLHEARREWEAAARIASSGNPSWMTPERVTAAVDLWIKTILQMASPKRDSMAQEAIDSFVNAGLADASKHSTIRLFALFRDRSALTGQSPPQLASQWMRWLLEIRQGGAVVDMPPMNDSDRELAIAAADRLIADGEASKLDQRSLARAILMLVGTAPSLPAAQGYGWTGDWKRAASIIEELRAQNPDDLQLAKDSASLLSCADDDNAKRMGQRLWTSLSSQLQLGSTEWHFAKLSAIDTMRSLGDYEDAKKLVNYILLTQPPTDSALVARYQAALK